MNMDRCKENVIEWIEDQERATVTLSQRRTITKIRKLAELHPDEVQILYENKDGSIMAHVPTRWVRINPPAKRSENQREAARKNMTKYLRKNSSVPRNQSQFTTKTLSR